MKKKILIILLVIVALRVAFEFTKEPVREYLESEFEKINGCTGCPPAYIEEEPEGNSFDTQNTDSVD